MKTLLLLSGGMDSAVCLHRFDPDACICFDYGQPHGIEIGYARRLAEAYETPFDLITLPSIPLVDDVVFAARNAILLSHAASHALSHGFGQIMIGCNYTDSSRFSDCTKDFLNGMRSALDCYGIVMSTPFIHMTKAQIKALAKDLRAATWSCYAPTERGEPCGTCLPCRLLED